MTQGYTFEQEFAAHLPRKPPPAPRRTIGTGAMGAAVSVATYPPVGQVTQLASPRVVFYAVADVKNDDDDDKNDKNDDDNDNDKRAPEVALWHSPVARLADADDDAWVATPFAEMDAASSDAVFWDLQAPSGSRRFYYQATVDTAGRPLHFTVRFRDAGSISPLAWRWVGDEQGLDDGTVLVNPRTVAVPVTVDAVEAVETRDAADVGDVLSGVDARITSRSVPSQVPNTHLWELGADVAGVDDDYFDTPSAYTRLTVGSPWHGAFVRWMALVRIWTPWIAPRHGRTSLAATDLGDGALLCTFLSAEGRHLVLLAVSGVHHLQSVFYGEDHTLSLDVRSDSLQTEQAQVLVAVGDSFETACAAVLYHARGLVQVHSDQAEAEKETVQLGETDETDVHPLWLEEWYDGLGYCTWNALGQQLTEDKIVDAVGTLADHDILVSTLIIDDNWQSLDRHGHGQFQYSMTRFEADATTFPHGLAHAVHRAMLRLPSIRRVAVWHALLGYWGGITPAAEGGELAQAYRTRVVDRAHPARRHLPVAGPMTVVDVPDVHRFYTDFYDFLRASGVDGVKTDAQFMLDTWTSAAARRDLAPLYQDAWMVATLRHFGSRAISCMSQTPAILFRAQLPRNRPAVPVRNSDDFFPDVPASHPWHVWANAHNALLTQHLNVLPDWDMFQTVHAYSGFHAAARCLSGGPICISDRPGEHDTRLLDQVTGRGVYGNTVVFRPSVVGRTADVYTGFHDGALLKVASFHGSSDGTGLLGLFNVEACVRFELVPVTKIPGVDSNTKYVIRAHSTGHVTPPVDADAMLTVALGPAGYDIVSAYRVHAFAHNGQTLYVANLGLVGKMAAAATLASSAFHQRDDTGRVALHTALKAPGVLGVYVSGLADGSVTIADSLLVTMRAQAIPAACVRVSPQDASVLEIDAARAWAELGFTPMLNNEIQLVVYISPRQTST